MKTLPPGVTQRLILVRHGEPEATARGRCYGKHDVGLSAQGRAQIERIAHFLQATPLDAIYASPRRRAVESAQIIAQTANDKAHDDQTNSDKMLRCDDDLAEMDFGAFEGLTYEEVATRHPIEYSMWMQQPTRVQFPDGENFSQMQRRVRRAVRHIRARREEKTVAIVSHGGVNRIVLATFLRVAARDIFRIEQNYAAINVIDFYDEMPIVRFVNLCPQFLENHL